MSGGLAQTSPHASLSDHCCQVRVSQVPCLAAPVVEVALVTPSVRGMDQRTVRACAAHLEVLAMCYDNQIVATRPYVREQA